MTAVIPDIDVSTIEALDFDPALPCVVQVLVGLWAAIVTRNCTQVADYVVSQGAPCCGPFGTLLVCQRCWDLAGTSGVMCRCRKVQPRDVLWRIVSCLHGGEPS